MATRVTSTRFVGRAAELAELRDALADAVGPPARPALAFVAGESGVGKTRLLCELERDARADGVRVLSGECVDLGESELAYAPIVAALRPLTRAADPVLDDLPTGARDALEAMLPGLGRAAIPHLAPEEATGARAALFEALLTLIERLAADDGLLLVMEDLHWADRSTRAFLTYLAASLVSERVLVVLSYRPDELHRRHPLRPVLAELERSEGARRVDLAPFTRAELGEQLADILGAAPEPTLMERLWTRSEGNALYAEELLAAGLDGRGALPPTLREALMLRVERLAAPTQDVLSTLALGGRLEHALLAEATGFAPDVLRDALRDGVAAQIVRVSPDGAYGLRHALLAEVIADDLLPGERTELHSGLARAFESHSPPGAHNASAVAHHHAAAGDQPRALAASVRAGEAAEAVRAYGEAAALYERALELWDRVPDAPERAGTDHVGLLRSAAWCRYTEGDAERAETLLRAASEELDAEAEPEQMADVLERLARQEWRQGRPDDARRTQARALALLPDHPTAARAMVLSSQAKQLMLESRYREAIERARAGLAEARAAGAAMPEIRSLDALGVSLAWMGDPEGLVRLREATALALEHEMLVTANTLYANLADVLLWRGRGADALAAVEEGLALSAQAGHFSRWLELMKGEICFQLGDWAAVAELLPEHGRRARHDELVNETHRRVELALALGEHDRASALLDAAEGDSAASREPQFIGPHAVMRAELARRAGDLAAARAAIEDGLDRIEFCSEDSARISMVSLAGLAVEADAAVRARDLGEDDGVPLSLAEGLLARLEATAGEHRPIEAAALVAGRALAARAAGRDDPDLWAEAAATWTAAERPYPAAQARWGEAEARLTAGDRDGAATAARVALEGARALGASWLASEVEGFSTRARLRDAEDPQPGAAAEAEDEPFGLTPRERQVLELLAGGATNREIGAQLYMAEKTASVHVSRILAKLDVRTRTEAAAVAHRLGLLS